MMSNCVQAAMIRPQPLGIYSGVASSLLLPEINDPRQSSILADILAGDCEGEMPEPWRFFQAAVHGNIETAWKVLNESRVDEDGDLRAYNLFVLRSFMVEPSLEQFQQLRARFQGNLRMLLDLAAFNVGLALELPEDFELDGEFRAWELACAATLDLERENFVEASEKLKEAVQAAHDSPLLEAILLAQSALLAHNSLNHPIAIVQKDYESAIAIAKQQRLPGFLAELWTQLGMILQQSAGTNRECGLAAIRAYQAALQTGIDAATQPHLFADLHNNLGLAYLALPNSDTSNQLRTGIAIQSFRAALDVLETNADGEQWARISMNLANALQYAPTSHPESNLIQAVEIYDQVLTIRTRAREPVTYAVVLLNQANALAHLGIFKPALEKAAEAYKLFQWHDQTDQAVVARELVERINDAIAAANSEVTNEVTTPNVPLER